MSAPVRALAAAGLLLLASCAVTPVPRLAAPPDPDRVRSRLLQEEAATRTVRGLARLVFEGPSGSGSASQVVVVALPDRARVEALTPLGTTALVATELRAFACNANTVGHPRDPGPAGHVPCRLNRLCCWRAPPFPLRACTG
jgi:hypothetical protein